MLDLVQPLAFWRQRRRRILVAQIGADGKVVAPAIPLHRVFSRQRQQPPALQHPDRLVVAALFSLQAFGLLDPLVIFQRAITSLIEQLLRPPQPPMRIFLSLFSLLFLASSPWSCGSRGFGAGTCVRWAR